MPDTSKEQITPNSCLVDPARRMSWRSFAGLLLVCIVLGFLWYDYQSTRVPFTIIYDGFPYERSTHQKTIEGALTEAGITVSSYDRVEPEIKSLLLPHSQVRIQPAHRVIVEADLRTVRHFTQKHTPREIFSELGIEFSEHDRFLVGNQEVSPDESILDGMIDVQMTRTSFGRPLPIWNQPVSAPMRIALQRAVTLYVDDEGIPNIIHTTAATIGEALRKHDIILYLGDRVSPELGCRVSSGLKVYLQRSAAIELVADGHSLHTRTRGETVGDVLAQQQVALVGADFVEPSESTLIQDGLSIQINRVSRATIVEQEMIPFETVWRPAMDIEIDNQRVEQEGSEGVSKRRLYAVYHNGQEVERHQEDEWLESEPENRIIAYGTKIVPRQLTVGAGSLKYWRKIRMLATSYSAATSGKSPDHPRYGITFTGAQVEKGIVAVDPKVIGLKSQLYVPGYGFAQAADTGGGIIGRRVDLGFSDDDLEMWYRWVDVFVLGDPPPDSQIRWVLPNWPRERG